MALSPSELPAEALEFLTERHLATLTTLRADGSPHVVAVGFTWDPAGGLVRVITSRTSIKARNAQRGGRAAVCQVEGRRWITLEGVVALLDAPEAVADAEGRYERRYRRPRPNPQRVVVTIAVDRVLGSAPALASPRPLGSTDSG
jgi:PPOX class probable F420-dependent enzyme